MSDLKRGHIWLVGFSGSGKSTIGPILAKIVRRPFFDTDAMIERRERRSISDIFAQDGERYFRALEAETIAKLAGRDRPTVIALGGGAFQSASTRKLIRTSGTSVYLRSGVSAIYKRLVAKSDRPLLQVTPRKGETLKQARVQKIAILLAKRAEYYEKADVTIPVSSATPHQIANRIISKRRELYG